MADIPMPFSIIDANPTAAQRKSLSSSNLFQNYSRSRPKTTGSTLPIITVPSFSNFQETFLRMATNKKSATVFNISTESAWTQLKSRTTLANRQGTTTKSKSSLGYSPTIVRPSTAIRSNFQQQQQQQQQQQNAQFLYVVNTPLLSHQIKSVSMNSNHTYFNPPAQPRSQYQYGHFLAHLRRQSAARTRRKLSSESMHIENGETSQILHPNKTLSTGSFQSASNYSLTSLTTDTSPVSTISIVAKRTGREISTYRELQRTVKDYRNASLRHSFSPTRGLLDTQLSSSVLMTPRNSVVDDSTAVSSLNKPPYELHINDDMLNYCYISDESNVKYRGQLFPTAS